MSDMTVLDGEGIAREAERQYLYDPLFSARVKLAVAAIRSLIPDPLSKDQEYLVRMGAAVGV